MDQEEEAAPEAPAATNRISADEGTEYGSSITDGMSDMFSAKEVMQDNLQEKNAESSVDQDLPYQRLGSRESASRSDKDMTLEYAREVEVIGKYLPEVFPKSGAINILRGTDEEGQERVTLGWNTDKAAPSACWFYLTIENLGDSLPDWLDTGTVIEEEQLNGGNVEGCLAMGTANAADLGTSERALSVLYENQGNYVLLNISGEISVEEVWEMLDSINKQ